MNYWRAEIPALVLSYEIRPLVGYCRGEDVRKVVDRANAELAAKDKRIAELESFTTWRPISEAPSAEVHARCGGWYLLRHDDGELCPEHWDRSLPWEKWSSGHREYTPIPPSDERRG